MSAILLIIENIIFWTLVAIIAWWGRDAPAWAFPFLFYYMVYLILRFIFMKEGLDRMIYLNALNIAVLLGLFYWYYRNH